MIVSSRLQKVEAIYRGSPSVPSLQVAANVFFAFARVCAAKVHGRKDKATAARVNSVFACLQTSLCCSGEEWDWLLFGK
jgi:hypothetical protein